VKGGSPYFDVACHNARRTERRSRIAQSVGKKIETTAKRAESSDLGITASYQRY